MTPELWKKLEGVFHEARELQGEEQRTFLAKVCGPDKELLEEAVGLIAAPDRESSFLDSPILGKLAEQMGEGYESLLGHTLGPYRIVSQLGRGGMGEVYLAEDTRLNRKIALKLLPTALTQDPDRLRRFESEAKAASALNHPNIVTIHEIGEAQAGRFIVMELVEGRTLRALAGEQPSLTSLTDLGAQMAQALAAAHAAGIVHRDVKPENIMVRNDGYVKVLDFGLALLMPPSLTLPDEESVPATAPGVVLGTVRYMSPEQARGERVSAFTDVFSLGIVFYELATGQHPFPAESPLAGLHAVISQTPLSPSLLNPEVSAVLEGLILQMLEKDARLRPTAVQVAETLAELAGKLTGKEALRLAKLVTPNHVVGRQRERAELRASFESVAAGCGLLLCVSGEPGIGKTTLVEDFLTELAAADQPCSIVRGRCSERLAGTEAYLPLLEALDDLLHSNSGNSAALAMKTLAPTWYLQVMPVGAANPSEARSIAEARAGSQERMKRELSTFLREVSRFQPLVLFFDDLHWADVSTIDVLAYLATKFKSLRILIIATYRPSDLLLTKHPFSQVKLDLQARGDCHDIALDFLSREEIADYLALEFPDHQFPVELATLIQTKTEGNPLFMVDLVRYLRDRKVIPDKGGQWLLRQPVAELQRDLPESIRSLIERKLEQIHETDRRLLVAASVAGYEFDSVIIAQALRIETTEVEERLEKLERIHAFIRFVAEKEFPNRTLSLRYGFVHVLYQNTLYASIRATRRAQLSAAVAQALLDCYREQAVEIASELALLFEAARDFERATEFLVHAAQRAAGVFANQEAAVLARRGLVVLKTLPTTPGFPPAANQSKAQFLSETGKRTQQELILQLTLGLSLSITEGWTTSEVVKSLTRVRELCQQMGGTPQLFPAIFGLCGHYIVVADSRAAHETADQLMRIAQGTQDPVLLIGAHLVLGSVLNYQGKLVSGYEHLERAVSLYDPQQRMTYRSLYRLDPGIYSRSDCAHVLYLLGYPERAVRRIEETVSLAQQTADPRGLSFAQGMAAIIHQFRREAHKTQECAAASIVSSHEHGISDNELWMMPWLGWAKFEQGWVEEGITRLRQSLAAFRAKQTWHSSAHCLTLLGEALGKTGQIEEALEVLVEAFDLLARTDERYYEAELYRIKGELVLKAQGTNPEVEGERYFLQGIEVARQQSAKSLELRAVMSLCRLWQHRGKQEEARQMLAEIYGWFTEGFDTADLQEAKALLDQLA